MYFTILTHDYFKWCVIPADCCCTYSFLLDYTNEFDVDQKACFSILVFYIRTSDIKAAECCSNIAFNARVSNMWRAEIPVQEIIKQQKERKKRPQA